MHGLFWCVFAALVVGGCGGRDVTTLEQESDLVEPGEGEAPASRTLELLTEPSTIDLSCRLAGLVARGAQPGPSAVASCDAVVEECESALAGVADAAREAVGAVPVSEVELDGLFGCPLSLAQLDACVADLIENVRDLPSAVPACADTDPAPAIALEVVATPACFIVAFRCPELLASLGGLTP